MPGRSPREDNSEMSQLQLHRISELHRIIELREREGDARRRDRGERDRDRRSTYRSALSNLRASTWHSPGSTLLEDLYPVDDEPIDGTPEPASEDQRVEQYGELNAQDLSAVRPCSFLSTGLLLTGWQTVLRPMRPSSNTREQWKVEVQLQEVDLERGHLSGCMSSEDVPHVPGGPVRTFWQGEILDNRNATFVTPKWGADIATDFKHWSKFPAFAALQLEVKNRRGRCRGLNTYPYIFMRWKELFYLDAQDDCGLTIKGFYYVCMSRDTGHISAFYFDPSCTPIQKLVLTAKKLTPGGGMGFGHFGLCS